MGFHEMDRWSGEDMWVKVGEGGGWKKGGN